MNKKSPGKKNLQISRFSFSSFLEPDAWVFDFWQKLCRWTVHFSALKTPQPNERIPVVHIETVAVKKQRKGGFGKESGRGWSERNDMKDLCFTPNKVVGRRRFVGHVHTLVPWNWSLFCCQDQGM